MKSAGALAALLAAGPALADAVASNGRDTVRLSDKPCAITAVIAQIPEPLRQGRRTAAASVSGQPFAACWRLIPQGVHLLYEDGDQGLIPAGDFKAVPEI